MLEKVIGMASAPSFQLDSVSEGEDDVNVEKAGRDDGPTNPPDVGGDDRYKSGSPLLTFSTCTSWF